MTTAEQARAVVLRHALDAADAAELLDMLGLGEDQTDTVPRVCDARPARRRGTVHAVSTATEARLALPPAPDPVPVLDPAPDPPPVAPVDEPPPPTPTPGAEPEPPAAPELEAPPAPATDDSPCTGCGTPTVTQRRYRLDPDGYRARGVRLRAAHGLCWKCYHPPGRPTAKVQPNTVTLKRAKAASKVDRWATALVDANTRLAAANDELEELRAQLADAHRDVGTWEGEYERVVDDQLVDVAEHAEMKAERDALAERLAVAERERDAACERLAEASLRIAEMQVAVGRVVQLADELAAAAEPPPHRHAWEWQPGLAALQLPCSCGEPFPPNRTPPTTDRQADRGHDTKD